MCANDDERPDAWQPTPELRWRRPVFPPCTIVSEDASSPVLQQQWHIPNSEHRDWRDVPTVREEDE